MKSIIGSERGFSLLELLVVVAMAAILLSLAAPSFNGILRDNRVESHQREVLSILNFARSEAVTRGDSVAVCGRATATTCVANVNDWSSGLLVFLDDGSGLGGVANDAILNGAERVLRDFNYQGANVLTVVDSSSDVDISLSNNIHILFDNRGYLSIFDASSAATLAGSARFIVCDPDSDLALARAVYIANTGRVTQAADTDNDGIQNIDAVNELQCL